MRRRVIATLAALAVAGCVSTQMRQMVGQSIQEAQIVYGPPVQVIEMPDGARAYQFRYGGGAVPLPGISTTTATVAGPTLTATTVGTPAAVLQTSGCLLTFIARKRGENWVIEDIRVPPGLVC